MNRKWTAGILAVALWGLAGCGKPPPAAPQAAASAARFDVSGEAALENVRRFVELGPRDAGTPGAEKAANDLRERLEEIGLEAEIQEFREASPKGPDTVFRNVLGRIPGTGGKILLFGSHYDTKVGIENFEGANDSGSSTGLLLELARGFREAAPHPMEIRFAFFDGEECMVEYGPNDGFHGSRHLAETMEADGSLSNVAAMILLDMVGDRDLTITIPRNSTPRLASLAFEAARAEGARKHFQLYPYAVGDDHVAFFERGVPAIDLIDFHFGSAPGQNDYWHTPEDAMDKISAESLGLVGRVAARMAEAILRGAEEK
ncbi:MAG: M28 family metallopeptidase [Kiritimatiellia bacterium]